MEASPRNPPFQQNDLMGDYALELDTAANIHRQPQWTCRHVDQDRASVRLSPGTDHPPWHARMMSVGSAVPAPQDILPVMSGSELGNFSVDDPHLNAQHSMAYRLGTHRTVLSCAASPCGRPVAIAKPTARNGANGVFSRHHGRPDVPQGLPSFAASNCSDDSQRAVSPARGAITQRAFRSIIIGFFCGQQRRLRSALRKSILPAFAPCGIA